MAFCILAHSAKRPGLLTALLLLSCAFVATARGDLTLASPFADHMVLQRDRPINLWGSSDANATITIKLGTRTTTATADGDGHWKTSLDALPAGGPFALEVSAGSKQVTLTDVLLGDVWLCSGQSNMQMSLTEAIDGDATAARASSLPKLRLAKVGNAWTDKPQSAADIKWQIADPASARAFSAVGYFFADELTHDPALAKVPLGLIQSSVGGTTAEAWIPKEALAGFDSKDLYDSMFGLKPTTLYNGMIAPLGTMQIRGVVWYQGESNSGHPENYAAKLMALFSSWRAQFNSPELPFIIIGLPDFVPASGGQYWSWLREAQTKAVESTPHTSLALSINTTDGHDLHPKEKREIGRRAALLARHDVYGEPVVARGPVFKAATIDGGRIRVDFTTDEPLTTLDGQPPRGFEIAGEDGRFRYADAVIDGSSVIVSSGLVASPKFVRYAWAGAPKCSLINKNGLPAYPFRTDDLPRSNIEIEPQLAGRRLNAPGYELILSPEGHITSFVFGGKQFLSNEPGMNGGAVIPTFFGPRSLANIVELGPDALSLSDNEFTMTISAAPGALTLTIRSQSKDKSQMQFSLASLVKAEAIDDKSIRLARKGAAMKVTGIDEVEQTEDGPRLKANLADNSTKTIVFSMEQ